MLFRSDARTPGIHAVSALTGDGLSALLEAIGAVLDEERCEETLMLPFAEGRRRAALHAAGVVVAEQEDEGGHRIDVRWTVRQKARWQAS